MECRQNAEKNNKKGKSMSIHINNNSTGYWGKITEEAAALAIDRLDYTGLKAWLRCAAKRDEYLWKYPDLSPDEIMELSKCGYLKRGDGINADWIFYTSGFSAESVGSSKAPPPAHSHAFTGRDMENIPPVCPEYEEEYGDKELPF